MALEPCNICGSLNSSEAEICLSCGNPPNGSKRPVIFRLAAIALVIVFALPILVSSFGWLRIKLKPQRQSLPKPEVALGDKSEGHLLHDWLAPARRAR